MYKMAQDTTTHSLSVLGENKMKVSLCNDESLSQQTVSSYITTYRNTITLYSVCLLFYKGQQEESLRAINQLKLQVSRRDVLIYDFFPIYKMHF